MAAVHVVKSSRGWVVKRGKTRSTAFRTQAEAVAAARRRALEAGGAEVVVHRADGRIRDKTSVGAAQVDERKRSAREPGRSSSRRAPRSDGPRTTVRLPEFLARVADQLASDLDVSRNDALVRLATRGAELYEQEQMIAQRREDRWTAVVPGVVDIDHEDLPAESEALAAIAAAREEHAAPAA